MNHPSPPDIFRHFPLVAMGIGILNAFILKFRVRKYIAAKPALADGYRKAVLGYLVWTTLPWLVMAYGIEIGGVPNPFSYLGPLKTNPYVVAWYGTIFLSCVLTLCWVVFCRGAEFLLEHPGLYRSRPTTTPAQVRLTVAGMCLIGMVMTTLMLCGVFPVPPIPGR